MPSASSDAAALSLVLWMCSSFGVLVLPEVKQLTRAVRELRRLFSQCRLMNTQFRQLKAQALGGLL